MLHFRDGHVSIRRSLGVDVAWGQCAFVSSGSNLHHRDPKKKEEKKKRKTALTLDAVGNINTL